jgi:hypothetical protein
MYDHAQVNDLKEALSFQIDHKSKRIERKRKILEHKSYDSKNSARLAKILSKLKAYCRTKGHVIVECAQIDNELKGISPH